MRQVTPRYVDDTDDYYYDDPVREQPKSRSWMVSLSLATIIALILIGDTIGGLVTVNNRRHIEFGQGLTFTIPCDQDGITVKPVAEYRTNGGDKEFMFDSLFIDGLSDNCLNKLFQLKFYNLSGPPLIIGYKNISGATQYDADAVKFLLSRKTLNDPFYAGLNWFTYPQATGMGSPPSPPDNNNGGTPILCGGDSNSTEQINYDWGANNPLPGCPTDNWLSHFQGFLSMPGTDDGNLHTVNLTLKSYGNTELWIDGGRTLVDTTTRTELGSTATSISLRKGQSYLLDYWVYKASGSAAAKLYWDLDSNGDSTGSDTLIPASVFFTSSQDVIEIAPTEGTTDYRIEATSSDTNNRGIKIIFSRAIQAGNLQFFTIETS